MVHHWRHVHQVPTDNMHDLGLEDAAYVAGWVLSGAAVLGIIMVVWHFHV